MGGSISVEPALALTLVKSGGRNCAMRLAVTQAGLSGGSGVGGMAQGPAVDGEGYLIDPGDWTEHWARNDPKTG